LLSRRLTANDSGRVHCRDIHVAAAVGLLAAALFTPPVWASWTVINLHPSGMPGSSAYGVSGGAQVGDTGEYNWMLRWRAALWSGSAGSWVDLHPSGSEWVRSRATAVSGGVQVGYVEDHNYVAQAALWRGSADSMRVLYNGRSFALGIADNLVAGYVVENNSGHGRAILWNLAGWDPDSPWGPPYTIWLHPLYSNHYASYALAIGDGEVVGYVGGYDFDMGWHYTHAVLWNAELPYDGLVDLHPTGYQYSYAYGVGGGQQVGYVAGPSTFNYPQAALWSGSAGSFVNLHPSDYRESYAWDVWSGQQVGYVVTHLHGKRAALWSGSASSFVSLHDFLGPEFTQSEARSITHENGFTYVVGSGYNSHTGRWEALMWVIPEPASLLGLGLALALFPRRR